MDCLSQDVLSSRNGVSLALIDVFAIHHTYIQREIVDLLLQSNPNYQPIIPET